MGSQMLLTYFSVLNLGDVQISPLLSRMWGAVVISVPLYFMQCSSAWPKPSLLAEMDAEQHPHWSASTVHSHCKCFLPKSPSPEFRKVSSLWTCSKYGLKIPHVLSSWSGGKYTGWQVMPAQNFGHVYRDTLHYSPNHSPPCQAAIVITGISLLIEVWEPLFPGHLMHGEGSTFCK